MIKNLRGAGAPLLVLAWGQSVAMAQAIQQAPPPKDEIVREADVVVIGERRSLLTIPGSGAAITAADLEKARPLTINEALRQAPGVFPRDEEGMGLRPNIGIRGLNPTRSSKVLLLEDGMPLSFAPYGDNASYYHPSMRRYQRIEVLKGASQVRFGPQTIGGVINYITPRAPDEFGGVVTLSGGSQGYLDADGTIGGAALGGRGLLHAQVRQSDSSRENQDLKFSDVFGKIEWDLSTDQVLTLRASRFKEDSQVTYSGLTLAEFQANPYGNPFKNDEFDTQRVGGAAGHAWFIDEATTLKTTLYGSHFTRDWWRQSSNSAQRPNDSSDPACGGMANLDTSCGNEGRLRDYWTWGLETRLTHEHDLFGLNAQTEIGLRYHDEVQERRQWNGDSPRARTPGVSVNGGVREDNDRFVQAVSGFLSTRIETGAWVVEPGVRVESMTFERRNNLLAVGGETDLTVVVPGLGVTYRVAPQTAIYAGVHKGFAPPRVEDAINNTTGGSVDLDAEESVSWELGVRGDVAPGLTLDAAFFRMDFDNQIVPQSVAGGVGSASTSAGETLHQGVELAARVSGQKAGWSDGGGVYGRASVTYLADAEFVGRRFSSISGFGATSVTGNRLPYAPEWLAALVIGWEDDALGNVEIEAQYTDEMYTDDLNTVAVTANGQRGLIDSALIWSATANVRIPETPLTLFVTGKNLTDEIYVVDRSRGILPGNKRSFQAGVSLAF